MSIRNQFRSFNFFIAFFLILILDTNRSFCQVTGYDLNNGAATPPQRLVYLKDIINNIYRPAKYPEIKGSPYYLDDWKICDIVTKDGKHFDSLKVKLNLYSQEFVCLSGPGSEITLKDGILHRLLLRDTNAARVSSMHVFASGIFLENNINNYPIFEVLSDGKAVLLNLLRKSIVKSADSYSVGEQKEFAITETLYIFYNSELKKCGKGAEFYTILLSDKKDKIEEFIRTNKLKCRNAKEAIQLVNFYNSL